jgi:hypothetical protein
MMDELFDSPLPGGQRSDIQICIFPHLREFLTVDLRDGGPNVTLMDTSEIFTPEFFKSVEEEISAAVRDHGDFPFAHLINLPMRLEEAVRETAMTYILERLGVHLDDDEDFPTVVVYIITGGALQMHRQLVLDGLKDLLQDRSGKSVASQWEPELNRLVQEEHRILKDLSSHDLAEAVQSDSPDYFTLWENRN